MFYLFYTCGTICTLVYLDYVEPRMTTNELVEKSKKIFSIKDINSEDFFKEVRRLIMNQLDGSITPEHFHSFCRTYERNGGIKSTWSHPKFDAICLILGRSRSLFDKEKFYKLYPSTKGQIDFIR